MSPTVPGDRRTAERRTEVRPHDPERRTCEDRRRDMESRERVEWLEGRYRRVTELLIAMLVTTLLVVTVGFVVVGNQADDLTTEVNNREADTKARVDESCRLAEGKQRDSVLLLRQTYTFLVHPPKALEGLVPYAKANLPKVEADARTNDAPDYCNAPGVGLPEPDPEVPVRPLALRVNTA